MGRNTGPRRVLVGRRSPPIDTRYSRVLTPEVVNCVSALLSRVDGSAMPEQEANLGPHKRDKRSHVSYWLRLV